MDWICIACVSDGMAMLQMRGFNQDKSTQLAALQFSNKLFLKCEGEATDGVILKAEVWWPHNQKHYNLHLK